MKHLYKQLLTLLLISIGGGFLQAQKMPSLSKLGIVPQPSEVIVKPSSFTITSKTKIVLQSSNNELFNIGNQLKMRFKASAGFNLEVAKTKPLTNYISIKTDSSLKLNNEGYHLNVSTTAIEIEAKTARGAFYAIQTLLQLLPSEMESNSVADIAWQIPCVSIADYPRFAYRGMHLDVCRHFFSVEFIKKQLNIMAMYKLNTFHWHLTDDQGWRIEIKKYPKLTDIGSKRVEAEGNEYSGFYTQEQIKDVVRYANERFINVIPEIELPGHALAALAAYPEYSCTGSPFKVRNIWSVEADVFCAGNDETFQFIDNIISEVITLFPYEYFHIGGDECVKDRWKTCPKCQLRIKTEGLTNVNELQSYFVKRVEKNLQDKGKKMIGWDEILEGGLASSATVMSWRGEDGGIAAANQNHNVIMTPDKWTYLDYYQGSNKVEPQEIGGLTTLENTYEYNPIPKRLPSNKHHYILGTQGNVWTEYMYTPEKVEYQIYPRIIALAEVAWSLSRNKNYTQFLQRMNNQFPRLNFHNINYHIPLPESPSNFVAFTDTNRLAFTTTRPIKMVYTLDGTEPTATSQEYKKPILLKQSTKVKIRSILPTGPMSAVRTIIADKQPFATAKNVLTQPGLKVALANGNFRKVADLEEVIEWTDTTVKDIRLKFDYKKPSVAIFTGYIEVPTTDVYYFSTEMEQLYIAGKLVVNNDGLVKRHSPNDGSIALAKGKHQLKLVFINNIVGGCPSAWNEIKILYRKNHDAKYLTVLRPMLSH